jgi:Zinc binding domain
MSEPSNKPGDDKAVCPRCGQPGRAVSAVTVGAMVGPETSRQLASRAGFRFCSTPTCEVAYFNTVAGELVLQSEVRAPIFQKSGDPHRLVCYCFGHTVEAIQSEVRASGSSRILGDIKGKCAQGLDRCERTNPQGSCCLGNVQRVIREAGPGTVPPATGSCCCCGGD